MCVKGRQRSFEGQDGVDAPFVLMRRRCQLPAEARGFLFFTARLRGRPLLDDCAFGPTVIDH